MSNGAKIIPTPKTTGRATSIITSLILSVIGIAGSSHLLLSQSISEGSFVALVIVSVLVGLVIFFEKRIKSVSFKNGSLDLEKIEEVRIEVEAKREEIEELAYLTVRLVILSQSNVLTFGRTADTHDKIYAVSKRILEAAGIPKSDEVFQQILTNDDQ